MLIETYLDFLGRITRPEQRWKNQGLVEPIEYFAASFD